MNILYKQISNLAENIKMNQMGTVELKTKAE